MENVTKKSASKTDLSAFSMNTQAVAMPVTPIKTKAAYKLYPPSILNGTGLKNNKRGKRALKRSSTKKDVKELTPPVKKKGKNSPPMGKPWPLKVQPAKSAEDQHEKPAKDQPTTSEASTMTDAEELTPPLLKKGKDSPPMVEQPAKPAKYQPTTCEASTMTDAEELTPPLLKKGKDSSLMEEQPAKPAKEQPTTCEASTMTDVEELTPSLLKRGKDSSLMEEPQPLAEHPAKLAKDQREKAAKDQPTTSEASSMTDVEEITPPLLKKSKDSPPMEEPQPLVEQPAKLAEDRPTTCEASSMTDAEEVTPPMPEIGKDSPLVEEPQPLMEQPAKPAEDQPTTAEASTMTLEVDSQ